MLNFAGGALIFMALMGLIAVVVATARPIPVLHLTGKRRIVSIGSAAALLFVVGLALVSHTVAQG